MSTGKHIRCPDGRREPNRVGGSPDGEHGGTIVLHGKLS
nr:MAG TPA: hypothetical protein [Caudoviricetes sp.]